jgi:hypothetical protein
LRDVVHDCPLVVEGSPRATAGGHLEDHAAERPDVDGSVTALRTALDDFWSHVHRGTGHGLLLAPACGAGIAGQGFALAGDDFGRTKIDVFDDAVVVQ